MRFFTNKEARGLPVSLVEEIIERSFKHSKSEKPDISLVNLLLEQRSCKTIFDLLMFEEKKIISRDVKLQFQDGPALTWELNNFSADNYHKESEPFLIDGHIFILKIQFSSDSLQLKISSVDTSDLQSALNISGIPADFFQSYQCNPARILSAMYQIEVGGVRITDPKVSSFIEDGYSSIELVNLSNFEFDKYLEQGKVLKIQLYFKLKHTHAAIMSQIARNFNFYHNDKAIKLLNYEHILFFYSYEYLEVMSEDQVLISFINWFSENTGKVEFSTISEVVDQIRWNHVNIHSLHK